MALPSSRWLFRALSWMTALAVVALLAPFALIGLPDLLVAHALTLLPLLGVIVALSRRATRGEPVSWIQLSGVLGAAVAALSLAALAWAFVLADPAGILVFTSTWIALPVTAMLGAAAGIVLGAVVHWARRGHPPANEATPTR